MEWLWSGKSVDGLSVLEPRLWAFHLVPLRRPPGHHAHQDQMNGYCMFNQLAVAARYAQRMYGVKRVLIVDWDVHHGQGTQFTLEEDPSVLYFSLHRYDNTTFWPHLPESSSAAVGKGHGERFNVNVAWNQKKMSDSDYITAFLTVLLPVAYEFQPQLVLVAAGYDAGIGDPKGEMSVTPAGFSHLTHLLMSLAQGRLILSLEGGYNLRSLAEGACASLKILLGDPCPRLTSLFCPCKSSLDSVSATITAHRVFWKMLQDHEGKENPIKEQEDCEDTCSRGTEESPLDEVLDQVMEEVTRKVPEKRTALVYDEQMMEHYNMWDSSHPEAPQRISQILKRHNENGLLSRCSHLPSRLATKTELQMCHRLSYIQKIEASARMKPRDLHRMGGEYNSIYINSKSYNCACLAVGSTFNVVESVLKGEVQNGVCVVRPPGHHAEPGEACGFCFFNTVALAARYAQSLQSPDKELLRVMILDWDVHHGNGTQHIFQDDSSVLYVSLHRYDEGRFFPSSEDAAHDQTGVGKGEGFNVNIPWNGGKMGDTEYLMAFHRVVMPIAYEFNPQLVLISAGFDAARGDPLGGCQVSPEGYAHMTHLLMGLAGGRIVLVLEGGYNLTSISESMALCTQTLLGDPPPPLSDLRSPRPSALRSIRMVRQVHHKYWKSLRLNVTGPPLPSTEDTKLHLLSPARGSPRMRKLNQEIKISPQVTGGQSPQISPRETTNNLSPRSLMSPDRIVSELASPQSFLSTERIAENTDDQLASSPVAVDQSPMPTLDAGIVFASPESMTIGTLTMNRDVDSPPAQSVLDPSVCSDPGEQTTPQSDRASEESPRISQTENQADQGILGVSVQVDNIQLDVGSKKGGVNPGGSSKDQNKDEDLQQILTLRDLQLIDNQRELDPAGGARRKITLSKSKEDEHNPSTFPPTFQQKRGLCKTPSETKLLCEAAGGYEAKDSQSVFQVVVEPALQNSDTGFAVTPLSWCPHLVSVSPAPPSGLRVTEPCSECGSEAENWVCLTCYKVLCGRYVSGHMLTHGITSGHNLVLSFSDLSVWCYSCESYIHHEVLSPAKSSAYSSKFGEEVGRK
ncbi:hypothetical protein GDO86_019126 [Hymenochirus boettgeri]|uniref:Protein deacetylase HDAC6 n=1 Tax=Hymenochirus boettgeri TaxID=247094 RepID=A0A8T2IH04_9PIPI|nr:hypothetical protein GDO86_019126 [Hymenochirus boettgeri]